MPKPKYDDPEESKRFLETAQKYAPVSDREFDRAFQEVAASPPIPMPETKKRPRKRAKR